MPCKAGTVIPTTPAVMLRRSGILYVTTSRSEPGRQNDIVDVRLRRREGYRLKLKRTCTALSRRRWLMGLSANASACEPPG